MGRNTRLAPHDHYTDEAARIRGRLARLAVERQSLEMRLSERETGDFSEPDADPRTATVTDRSPAPAALERSRSGNGAHVWIFFPNLCLAHSHAASVRTCSPKRWSATRTVTDNLRVHKFHVCPA